MIRNACSQFKGQSADQYHNGAVLKYVSRMLFARALLTLVWCSTDDAAAIKCQNEQKAMYGANWYAGQRYVNLRLSFLASRG